MATHSSILAWRVSMDREGWWAAVHGVAKTRTQLRDLAEALLTYLKSSECKGKVLILVIYYILNERAAIPEELGLGTDPRALTISQQAFKSY